MNDFTIIGAGIVGLATAYHLRRVHPDAGIELIDKESGPAFHQSSRNSGVIHSGIYYPPGSLKASNCLKGYSMLLEFCRKHEIEHDICGKIIVAQNKEQMPGLTAIYENGIQNGLSGLKWLDQDEIRDREPHIKGYKAVYIPQSGIVRFADVAAKLTELLKRSGVQFQFSSEVKNIEEETDQVIVETSTGNHRTRQLITSAGLYADKLAMMTNDDLKCQIVPFRGEYYKFKIDKKHLINHLVYPVPNPNFPFLGVHFTRRINGDIEAGPNAVLAFAREGYSFSKVNARELMEALSYKGFQKLASKHLGEGWIEMKRSISKTAFVNELRKLMPEIKATDLIKARAGVRAQAINKDGSLISDFHFIKRKRVLHVINAPSPAATASLAIGEYICGVLRDS